MGDDEESCGHWLLSLTQNVKRDIFDATTGQMLKRELVDRARAEKMAYFESKKVWGKRPIEEAWSKMGKAPISVKWVIS